MMTVILFFFWLSRDSSINSDIIISLSFPKYSLLFDVQFLFLFISTNPINSYRSNIILEISSAIIFGAESIIARSNFAADRLVDLESKESILYHNNIINDIRCSQFFPLKHTF